MISDILRKPPVVAALGVVGVLGAGGALTRIGPWYESLHKPAWQPPGWLFAPAWTTIGIFTGCSAVSAWEGARDKRGRRTMIVLFAVNGSLNVLWSALFFTQKRPDWALIEVVPLWLSIVALMTGLAPSSRRATWLLSPYLVWVAIAALLNLEVVRLNAPFGSRAARS